MHTSNQQDGSGTRCTQPVPSRLVRMRQISYFIVLNFSHKDPPRSSQNNCRNVGYLTVPLCRFTGHKKVHEPRSQSIVGSAGEGYLDGRSFNVTRRGKWV